MAMDEDEMLEQPTPVVGASPAEEPEEKREEDEAVKKFVSDWTSRITNAREYWGPTFKRMRKCMAIAKFGDTEDWTGKDDAEWGRYVVPIAKRAINQSVAQLYAKNPTTYAERKKRRMHTVWDGDMKTLTDAQMQMAQMEQAAVQGAMVQPDPNTVAVIQDAQQVMQYIKMTEGLADTLNILDAYYMGEQAAGYKQQFKALVRRIKVCGIGYVTLNYQRLLRKQPDISGKIQDTTDQIARVEQLMREASRDDFDDESAKLEELRKALADLQSKEYIIAREGPVHGFPRATAIILDPCVQHVKTLSGCNWYAEERDMTPDDIEEEFKVDVRNGFKKYNPDKNDKPKWSDKQGKMVQSDLARVWRVQDKRSGLEFVICDGYCGYLKAPAAPDVKLERFFNLFVGVFNEIESEDDQIPPSDVWDVRHTQRQFNEARQGLSEHRRQNKPGTCGPTGALLEKDLQKLSGRASGDHIELSGLSQDDDVRKKIMPIPTVAIDAALYDVEPIYGDLLRTVGAQAATQGTTSGDTATESAIANAAREVNDASAIDDLDDLLSDLAKARGQLMLFELSKEIVIEIVGPGAVWPELPQTREEIAKDLVLDIKAGSSGRPNKAAKIANMERAMPTLIQLPGINPVPIGEEYVELLDIDAEKAVVEGLPSIVAMNAAASKPTIQPSVGDPEKDPGAQGPQGAQNAPAAQQNEPGPQPAFPTEQPMA